MYSRTKTFPGGGFSRGSAKLAYFGIHWSHSALSHFILFAARLYFLPSRERVLRRRGWQDEGPLTDPQVKRRGSWRGAGRTTIIAMFALLWTCFRNEDPRIPRRFGLSWRTMPRVFVAVCSQSAAWLWAHFLPRATLVASFKNLLTADSY